MDKITSLFIREPEREFHIREIAKLTGKSPTTASKYAKKLEKASILSSKRFSNHLILKANTESISFRNIKREYNLKHLSSSGLVPYLEEQLNNPEAIIVFGSYAKGEDISKSDIDMAVITPLKKELSLEIFEKKLKHKIQLFLFSKKDVKSMKKVNRGLLNNLINGSVISGFWEVFT